MFVESLDRICKTIDNHSKLSRSEIMERCINQKLNDSLNAYNRELMRVCTRLLSTNSLKLLGKINRVEGNRYGPIN